jgi:hypothetical protein
MLCLPSDARAVNYSLDEAKLQIYTEFSLGNSLESSHLEDRRMGVDDRK